MQQIQQMQIPLLHVSGRPGSRVRVLEYWHLTTYNLHLIVSYQYVANNSILFINEDSTHYLHYMHMHYMHYLMV